MQTSKHNAPPSAADRRAVVVLGMHRSGTSALCGALNLLGVDFGKHLMPATGANEQGYWEHKEIVRAHDELLSSLNSRWDDHKPLPSDWVEREKTVEIRSLLLGILERDFGHSPLFGIKDPRLCLLMPLWFPIFHTLEVKPHFVLVVRHPWEVAASLAKRDGIEHPKSYLLWLEHVVQAESATRSHPRSFVRYEEMVDDPVASLSGLRKQLGISLGAPSEVQPLLRSVVDPSLRHHQLNKEKSGHLRQPVPQLALDFYETIRTGSTSDEIARKVEPLVTQFIRGRELFYPLIDLVTTRMEKLSPEEVSKVSLEVSGAPREVHVSALFWLDARVTNTTNKTLAPITPYPVCLAYHWMEKTTREMIVFEGHRSGLYPALEPNATGRYPIRIVAPDQPGEYILQTTIVQDGVCWFEDIRPGLAQEFAVSVIAGADHNTVSSSPQPALIKQSVRARITIGVPIYRGKLFLEESLASVRNQTYPEIEVIMSVDGRDPECEAICKKFLTDSRFRLVIQPRRLGWMDHTNWLMSQVQSEFWHLQEQDDVIEPAFLETLLEHACGQPNAAAVFGDVRTFEASDIQITMSSVIGSAGMRQMKLIHEHFQGVAPLGLIRTDALRMSGGLQGNEFENFAADSALMAGLARWGELHRIPVELYRKRVHAESTHATWWGWAMERRSKAWQAHCLAMFEQALLIDATPQDRRLLWLAVIERVVSPRIASHFLHIAEFTVAEPADMLDSFLQRARTSSIDIPGSLNAAWEEIDTWTKGFFCIP